MSTAASLLARGPVAAAARRTSDWVDLQWSHLIETLRLLAPRMRGRLLDVGCGDKPYEHFFRPHVAEYLGIEHQDAYAQTDAHKRGAADLTYDGRRLPFEDASFDSVMSIQVLEHTPHPGELIVEMARVLRPGGPLLLSAPFSFRLHEEPNDFFRFSPHGLRTLCDRAGLTIEEVHPHGGLWSLLGHKLNSYLGLRVARLGGLAQSLGKLGHEGAQQRQARTWALPLVAPTMLAVSALARVLDRAAPDPTESLGFTILASKS
jgi:SAM-dependent methyltransferase